MAGKYQLEVGAVLDTKELESQLNSLKTTTQKSNYIHLDANTSELTKKIKEVRDGFGNVFRTVEQQGKQTITTVIDKTDEWKRKQEDLKDKIRLSTQQLDRMAVNAQSVGEKFSGTDEDVQKVITKIRELQGEYQRLLNSSQNLDSEEVKRLNNQQKELQESINLIKAQGSAMQSSSSSIASFVMQYMSLQAVINKTVDISKQMVSEVFALDASLTELAKVTNMTKDELGGVTEQAYQLGEEIGRTGREVIDAVATFSQAGYSLNEAFDLGETALVMTNIADGIDNVSEASTNLISIIKGFGLEVSDSTHIIDAFNNVSNNMAASYANLADVMQRSSATLASGGTSLEEGIGLATAALEVLGNKPEQVGRSLTSLTQRLRGLTEVGEDGYEGASKLNEALESITSKYGKMVSIFGSDGNLRSTFEILKDLAEVYPKLTENERQFIGEKAAGKTQIASFNAILSNFDSALEATELALDSTGSAARENAIFLESLEGKINTLKSAFSQLASTSINSGMVGMFLDLTTAVIKLVDALGGLPTILTAVTIGFTAMNFAKITSGFASITSGLGLALTSLRTFLTTLLTTGNVAVASQVGLQTYNTAMGVTTAMTNGATVATNALKIAMGGIIGIGITAALFAITKAFDAVNVTVEEQKQKVTELQSGYDELKASIEELSSKNTLTESESEYLGILKQQLELKKEALEIEKETLLLKEITGKGSFFDSGEFGEMASAIGKAKTYINEYSSAVEACGELSGEAFNKASQTATEAKNSLISLASSMSESYNKIKEGIDSGVLAGKNLDTAQAYVAQYEAIIEKLKELGVISTQTSTEVDALNESLNYSSVYLQNLTNAALPSAEAMDALDESTSNTIQAINLLNEAIAIQTAGMALSASQVDNLLALYPSLYNAVVQTADGYYIDIAALQQLKGESAAAFQTEINGSVESCKQVIADCQKKIMAYKAELQALNALKAAWGKTAQGILNANGALGGLSNTTVRNITGLTDANFVESKIKELESGIETYTTQIDNAYASLTRLESNARRVEIAQSNLNNEIKNYTEQANKASSATKSAKKEVKDYADEIASLGTTIKSTVVSLDSLKKNFEYFKKGYVNDAFRETKLSIGQIDSEITKTEKSLDSLISQYEKLSKNTKGDEAKKTLDELNTKIKAQQEYIKQLTDYVKEYNEELKQAAVTQLQNERSALNDIISQTVTLLKEELNAQKQAYENELKLIKEDIEAQKEALKEKVENNKKALQQQYDDLEESVEERKKVIKSEAEVETKRLKDQLSQYQELINKRKELLDSQEEERSYEEELAEKQEELAKLQQQAQELANVDTLEGRSKLLELQEQIAAKEKELQDFQRAWDIKKQKEALDEMLEEKENNLNEQIESVEDACDEETEALEEMLKDKKNQLDKDLAYWDNYLDEEEKRLEASLSYQEKLYEGYIEEIDTKLKQEGQLRLQAMKEIENNADTVYQKLVEWNRLYGDGITSTITKAWEDATEAVRKYGDAANIYGEVQGALDKMDSVEDYVNNGGGVTVNTDDNNKIQADGGVAKEEAQKAKEQLNQQKYLHDLMVKAKAENDTG